MICKSNFALQGVPLRNSGKISSRQARQVSQRQTKIKHSLAEFAEFRSKQFKGGLHAIPSSDNSGMAPLAPSPELVTRVVNSDARKGFEKARQIWRVCGRAESGANLLIAPLSGSPPEGDAKRTDAPKSPTLFQTEFTTHPNRLRATTLDLRAGCPIAEVRPG